MRTRARIETGSHDPASFRAALLEVPEHARDAWFDLVLGLHELPDDGDDLPRDCVPYLPCSVDSILRALDHAPIAETDVFVDLGAGLGRAATLVHLLTGARAVGLEIQRSLTRVSRDLLRRFPALRLAIVEGDATELAGHLPFGDVFFLYCPFGGARLARTLACLQPLARTRMLRIYSVDLPLPELPWLTLQCEAGNVTVHRTRLHDESLTDCVRRNAQSLARIGDCV
jgi:SAM-dependent methyltransferase